MQVNESDLESARNGDYLWRIEPGGTGVFALFKDYENRDLTLFHIFSLLKKHFLFDDLSKTIRAIEYLSQNMVDLLKKTKVNHDTTSWKSFLFGHRKQREIEEQMEIIRKETIAESDNDVKQAYELLVKHHQIRVGDIPYYSYCYLNPRIRAIYKERYHKKIQELFAELREIEIKICNSFVSKYVIETCELDFKSGYPTVIIPRHKEELNESISSFIAELNRFKAPDENDSSTDEFNCHFGKTYSVIPNIDYELRLRVLEQILNDKLTFASSLSKAGRNYFSFDYQFINSEDGHEKIIVSVKHKECFETKSIVEKTVETFFEELYDEFDSARQAK